MFVQTIDHEGDAARAGLREGDHILEINGLNVKYVVQYIVSMYIANSIGCIFRNASHSHVIKLLKGSGTNPTLLVSDNRPSVDKRRLSRISSGSAMSISDHRRRSAQFTKHVRAIVTVELCRNLASTMYLYTSLYRHLAFL